MSDSSRSLTAGARSLFIPEAPTLGMVGSVENVGQIDQNSIQKEVGPQPRQRPGQGAQQEELAEEPRLGLVGGHGRTLTCADEEDVIVSVSSCYTVCSNLGEGVPGTHL